MNSFFYTSASGWIAVILVGIEIALPYLLRRNWLSVRLGVAQTFGSPYLRRMSIHYWLGYLVAGLSFVHAWVPMQAGHMRRANMTGLWLATAALFLLGLQVALGLASRDSDLQGRRVVRGWHYWVMVAVVLLLTGHVWLNG
jgi:hypothetical protein